MARFFVDPCNITRDKAVITGSDVKHIKKVLRMKEGDEITLLDGLGNQYDAEICSLEKDAVICTQLKKTKAVGEPPVHLTIVQCLPKADKMELVIQKGTELGVSSFIPLQCQRSVVRLDNKKAASRQQRWQKIALEAAKQCRRPLVPLVEKPMCWQEVFNNFPENALVLMPWEGESSASLEGVLSSSTGWEKIYIIIGPEGGFEKEEVELAKQYGAKSISLGPRILRTETAGLALASIIMYLYGDLR